MDKIQNVNVSFDNPPKIKALISKVDGLSLTREKTEISLNIISCERLCFHSASIFPLGQHIVLEIPLFSSKNHIFGEITSSLEKRGTYAYDLEIISADYTYNKHMNSYGDIVQNKNRKELFIGGRQ